MVSQKLNRKIDGSSFCDSETGESLGSFIEGTLFSKEDTDCYIAKSSGFVIVDIDSLLSLYRKLTYSDIVRVFLLVCLAKTSCCVLCTYNTPLTGVEIAKKLEISKNEWYILSRKLIDCNILWQGYCPESGYIGQRIYILNPYVLLNRTQIHRFVVDLFKPIENEKSKKK